MDAAKTSLKKLHAAVSNVWQTYQELGPGNVDDALWPPVEEATTAAIEAASERAELITAIETAVDLAQRCVKHSQGLCFVTGEAGLLPRKDLHEKLESALATLHHASQ